MGKDIFAYNDRLKEIDKCLRNFKHPMTISEIAKKCNEKLERKFSERQYRYDLEKISNSGHTIVEVGKSNGSAKYVYASEDDSIDGATGVNQFDRHYLDKISDYLARFSGLNLDANLADISEEIDKILGYNKEDKAVISFEKTVLYHHDKEINDKQYLKDIFTAIIQRQPLDIRYEIPGRGERDWVVFPQFLKQYNQRWYLIALIHRKEDDKLQNIALDRILSMEPNQHIPYKQSDIDFAKYFEDVVGVTRPDGAEPVEVKLRVEKGEYPYIESKPIHPSQDELFEEDENYVYLSLYVYDNYELRSKLLSYGSKVTVMEPASLRDKLRAELQKAVDNY